MTKEFEMKMPQDVIKLFQKTCKNDISADRFANLCATWGANQEYRASYDFIDDAWGSDHARVYQESRRPIIQSEKEKAMEALEYIDQMATCNLTNYTCIDKLREHRNFLYKLIDSMPEEDNS